MWAMNSSGKWSFTFDKVGRWWNNNTEIDIVALDSTGTDIIFGECKYWKNPVGVDVLYSLEEKAKQVEWKRQNRREWFVLFSINGWTDELIRLSETRKDILLWS
jgi:AAA+ ATPase superfamily predicted ATPase